MSQSHEGDVASPPYTAPAWIDVDLGDALEPVTAEDPGTTDDEDDEALVASCVELAMKNLQHHRVRVERGQEEVPVYCFGSDDATLYAIEDGVERLMIGRGVGRDSEGCVYCLVAATSSAMLAMLDSGEVAPDEAFDHATELTLCSVFEADLANNVILVQHYRSIEDVPVEYRLGEPFLRFTSE